MFGLRSAGALLLLACTPSIAQQAPKKLLATARLARELATIPNDSAALRALVARSRHDIANFVIHQIEAYPNITECELQEQLADIFGIRHSGCGGWSTQPPRIFGWRNSSFVIAYCLWPLNAYAETILESYVRGSEGVRLGTNLSPAQFRGVITDFEQVCWFPDPDRYWILISGQNAGASGRALGGTAAVYEIGPQSGRPVWEAPPNVGNVFASARGRDPRWEMEYVDMKRYYADLPNSIFLDVFQVNWDAHSFKRIVHQPLH